jgi:hypothetical protein
MGGRVERRGVEHGIIGEPVGSVGKRKGSQRLTNRNPYHSQEF